MTVAVAVAAAKTSTGNQDITTTDLGGETPKACLFLYSRASANGTVTADAGASFGMTDGVNQCAFAMWAQNGATSVGVATKIGTSAACIVALKATSAIHSAAAFVAFIANGVTVNWTVAAADGWLVTALFFSGSDWTVACGTSAISFAGVTTALGFTPDCVLLAGASDAIAGTVATSFGQVTIGATTFGGGLSNAVQHVHDAGIGTRNNVTTASGPAFGPTWGAYRFGATQYGAIVTQVANGFTLHSSSSEPTHKYGYLALKYEGAGVLSTGKFGLTEDAGHQSYTGFGGTPQQFLLLLTQQQKLSQAFDWRFGNHAVTSSKSGGFAVGSTSDGNSVGSGHPTVHHSTANEDTITLLGQDGVANIVATFVSYDADGITLNYTDPPVFEPARGVVFATMEWSYLTIITTHAGTVQAWIED
jgi:hypothetical protein